MSSSANVKLYFHWVRVDAEPIYFFFLSAVHLGQNHFPFGFVVNPTQAKWNHSIGHWKKNITVKNKNYYCIYSRAKHTTKTFLLIFDA
jgi:hypothetical protein